MSIIRPNKTKALEQILGLFDIIIVMKDYKLIAFDLDLTLLDTLETSKQAYRHAFKSIGKTFDDETVVHNLSLPLSETFAEFNDQTIEYKTFFDAFISKARETFQDGSHFYDDAVKAIKHFKNAGKTLAIITNRPLPVVMLCLEKAGLTSYFTSFVTSDKITKLKPNPDPIYMCLDETGFDKEDMVYFGDAKNDWLAATSAGVDFVAVERYDNCNYPSDLKIHSFLEII